MRRLLLALALLALGSGAAEAQTKCTVPNYYGGQFHDGCLGAADLNRNNVDIYGAINTTARGFLPLIGGTLSGPLTGTAATFSAAVTGGSLVTGGIATIGSITTVPGLDPTGVANSTPAFTAAIAAIPANGGTLWVPRGTYLLNSNVTMAAKTLLEIDSGATFTGAGVFNAISDQSTLNNNAGRKTLAAWSTVDGAAWTEVLQMFSAASSGGTAYEKGPLYTNIVQGDTTAYTVGPVSDACTTGCKDAVGFQSSAIIKFGITTGRAWGGSSSAEIVAGSDGYLQSWEFDVKNSGGDQPSYNRKNTKTGVSIVSNGTTPATVGLRVQKGSSSTTFHDGVMVDSLVVTREAFGVIDTTTDPATYLFSVDPTGSLVASQIRLATPTVPSTSSTACAAGQISWATGFIYVCVATNTWQRAALLTW